MVGFSEKKTTEPEICILVCSTVFFSKTFFHYKKNWAR